MGSGGGLTVGMSWFLCGALVTGSAAAVEGDRPLLITVDDLPIASGSLHPDRVERRRITNDLLAVLAKHGATALGFVTWRNVRDDADRELLELWLAAGHELGNHTREHLDYHKTATVDFIADVEAARLDLAKLLAPHHQVPRRFRFPFLREGDTLDKLQAMRTYLASSGQTNLCPTLDTQDWSFEQSWVAARQAGDAKALARVGEDYQRSMRLSVEVQERQSDDLFGRPVAQVLLLHANEVGAAQWDALFSWLKSTGHSLAAPARVLSDPALATPYEWVGDYGPGLWWRIRAERNAQRSEEELRELLATQSGAWNRGDLETFCSVYADDARFLAPSGLHVGRDEVLARYRSRYPSGGAMGKLSLEVIGVRLLSGTEVSMLGDAVPGRVHGAAVAARWALSYPDRDAMTGLTLIVFKRTQGRWWIVEDASM